MTHSTSRPGLPATLDNVAAAARNFGRASAPAAPTASPVASDRVSMILHSPEAVGRQEQAEHLAHSTTLAPAAAVAILAAGPRAPALAAAMGGAGAMRAHLGLPADPERDAAVARSVEAFLAGGGGDAPAASSGKSDADEYAEGAASARRLLGR